MRSFLRFLITFLVFLAAAFSALAVPERKVVIQAPADFTDAALESLAARARARGVEVEIAAEGGNVQRGFDLLRLSTLPPSDRFRDAVLVFPVKIESGGFVFDGSPYRRSDEAVRLTASTRAEIVVLGNSVTAVLALAARWLAAPGDTDYEVISGDVSREGKFERRDGRLHVDPASDRDRIAQRNAFLAELKRRTRGAVVWEYPESAEAAATQWEKVAARFVGKPKGKDRLTVRLYPDAVTKAILTGSARPADLDGEAGALRVDVDASAPAEPDLVTPVFAAAGLALADASLLKRPVLLAAAGARRAGRWWGRDVKTFAAFARAAGVEPSIPDVLASAESISPVLDVGTVASWLDAGARLENEAGVEKSLGGADAVLAKNLGRWRSAAERQSVKPPPRRPMPEGFLRGVTYPAPETLEDAYVSVRSREALAGLAGEGFNSIALRPGALMRGPEANEILFVRRGARGETDEGLLHAIGDAHAAGMTAAVSPELLVAGGVPAGQIAVSGEAAWAGWFAAYRRFVVHEAVVAEAAGADLFVVGAGLTSTEEQKNEWKQAIAAVRLATGAALTYAASPATATYVPFWDALDAIGVELVDPLPRGEKVTESALLEAARAEARPLAELSRRLSGRPVVVTRASTADARAIGARYRALTGAPWWRGVYWARFEPESVAADRKAVLDGFRAIAEAAP